MTLELESNLLLWPCKSRLAVVNEESGEPFALNDDADVGEQRAQVCRLLGAIAFISPGIEEPDSQ